MDWLDDQRFDPLRERAMLVTGGAGFIGSHIARALLHLGCTVRVLDDLSSGHRENLPSGVEFVEASLLDDSALASAIVGCDVVFHEAAMVSVPRSVEEPGECQRVNIEGTQRLLEAGAKAGVRRVVFAASAAAYGDEPRIPSSEADPTRACSPYAASKIAGEAMCQAFACCTELSTVSLRYFNIFGPRQDPRSPYAAAISAFGDRLLRGEEVVIFGDGEQTRDFTYVENVVRANLLAASSERDLRGEVVNIGTGRRRSLLEVVRTMSEVLGCEASVRHEPPRAGDVRHSCADITRAREVLDYEPTVQLRQGLAHTLSWMSERTPA